MHKVTVIINKTLILLLGVLSLNLVYAQTLKERETIAEGNRQFLLENYAIAAKEYAEVLVKNPENVKANFNIGSVYYETKQYDKAERYFYQASKYATTKEVKAQSYHNMGNALMQSRKYKEAIEAYKKALRNNPRDNQTRYNLSLAKKLQKEQKKHDPKDLPKPSEFAKQIKRKADELSKKGAFSDAYQLMRDALLKDSTVRHFEDYIKKLNEVIILDTIR